MNKRKPKGLAPKTAQELIRHIKMGLTTPEIASIYGVNKQTVSNWVVKYKKQGYAVPQLKRSDKCTSNETKLKYMLELLCIDITKSTEGINNIGNDVLVRLTAGGIDPKEAKFMAMGVVWYLQELINQYGK